MSEEEEKRVAEFVWKHRVPLGLFVILALQAPLVWLKPTLDDGGTPKAFVEIAHVLVTSGLLGYLFSKRFEALLRNRLYGFVQKDWQEVSVFYSQDGRARGMGPDYPREPTLLIQRPMWSRFEKADSSVFVGGVPMGMSFNSGYEGKPVEGEETYLNGKWSELRRINARYGDVGFPDSLYTLPSTEA